MSRSVNYIFIKEPHESHLDKLLNKLHLSNYKFEENVSILTINKSTTLHAGFYNSNLIISHPYLPYLFFRQYPSDTEKRFVDTFPNSEITVVAEGTSISLFGYSLIKNGERRRVLLGSEGNYSISLGHNIQEEDECSQRLIFNTKLINQLKNDGKSDEEIEKYRVFESKCGVPALLIKRYLGYSPEEEFLKNIFIGKYTRLKDDNFESSPQEKEIQELIEHIRNISSEIKLD